MRRAVTVVGALLPLLILGACIGPPPDLRGGPIDDVSVADAQARDLSGRRVRWGGAVVSVTPGRDDTCFEVLARRLSVRAEPRPGGGDADGRFFACAPGSYDPVLYGPERLITVTGILAPTVSQPVGHYDYPYPVVLAEAVHLWPYSDRVDPYHGYYDPYVYPAWEPFWTRWWPWPYGLR